MNRHLGAGPDDPWCCVLPTFHVGGLGIHARAYRSGARIVSADWNAAHFAALCSRERIAFSSLVPAQVSDLVSSGLPAPPSLRAIVVGGAALSASLYHHARSLGWPLLPSYGMTECCSQVATASIDSPDLVLLSHFEARRETDGRLAFRGPSLLTGFARFDDAGKAVFLDPKVDGWFVSEDIGEIDGRLLRVEGRTGGLIKIGGESVDLRRLDRILDEILRDYPQIDAAIVPVHDERLGFVVHLAATGEAAPVREAFDSRVLPFERVRTIHRVDSIPRSPLGKLLRHELVISR